MQPVMTELESNILSAMWNDRVVLSEGTIMLKAEYFPSNKARHIFLMMTDLQADDIAFEPQVCMDYFNKHNIAMTLVDIVNVIVMPEGMVNYPIWFRALIDRYVRVKANSIVNMRAKSFIEQSNDIYDQVEGCIEDLTTLVNKIDLKEKYVNIMEELSNVVDDIEKERVGLKQSGIRFHDFPSLNILNGIKPGNLMAISGEYKSGKTTLAYALALDMIRNEKKNVAIFSLEMNKEEVIKKMLSIATGTRYGYLRNPSEKRRDGNLRFTDEQIENMIDKANRIFDGVHCYIVERAQSLIEIKSMIKEMVAKKNVEVVIVDYIGLIEVNQKQERRDLEISLISRTMKRLAMELGIVILMLSQENSEKKIAESKSLARDSDYWLSISHPIDEDNKEIKIIHMDREIKIKVDSSLFKVKIKASRHSESAKTFCCYLQANGEFVEMDLEHLEQYQGQK